MSTPPLHVVLRDARLNAGLQQGDVALSLGISQTALSYWENGRRSPSTEDLGRWAEAVGYRILAAPRDSRCSCGDDKLYWRGWEDCAAAVVNATVNGKRDA